MPTIIAIVIAVIAVAVAIGAWFRPMPKPDTPAAKTYSEQEVTDAKKAACDAFNQTQQTLKVTGSKTGDNPTASFIVAVNSRIAIQAVSAYLRSTAENEPALSKDLSDKVLGLSNIYRTILLKQLAEVPQDQVEPLFNSVDKAVDDMTQACK
ncbi:hypothetical protein [Mycolicibacterium sarraceniae]|uniref:hypothetical protein n=1 Tax=Mycolicibacterium sarraceniae TaxID=1534348 RepID=UPI0013D3C215|nr:hypothetical protein [Mycolicibacterium sarraceniae]